MSATLALGGLTYAVIEGAELGYGSAPILGALALSAVSAIVWWRAQAGGAHPMVPLDLFRSRYVVGALSIAFVTMAAFYAVVFLQSLYFPQERGMTALDTGLLFLPMTALVAILNPLVPRLAERAGPFVPIAGGQLLMVVGLVGLCLLPADAPVWLPAALMVPVGVGGSFTVPPLTSMVLDHIPAERAGTASGVLNTARQTGASLGVAVCGAFIATQPTFRAGLQIGLGIIAALLIALVGFAVHQRGRTGRRPQAVAS